MTQEPKIDLRVQKTHDALTRAMLQLLAEKPLHSITVSDLCDAARIRRATFYAHFRDKEDFMDFCVKQQQQDFMHRYACYGSAGCSLLDRESMRGLLHFFCENRPLLERQKSIHPFAMLTKSYAAEVRQRLQADIEGSEGMQGRMAVPPEVTASFLAGGVLGAIHWWLAEKPEAVTEEDILDYIRSMIEQCTEQTGDKEVQNER